MTSSDKHLCPTLRLTRQQFERPFCEFVREVFLKHPEWPCFKAIPPKRWTPRKRTKIDLDKIRIDTPIKQHVFGRSGAYRCILEEQRGMSAAEFKRMAESPGHQAPEPGHRDDDFLERSFWSSVTINPPLYGADTPVSMFDERVEYGWNLRDLGCLLKSYEVPEVAGVTSPMAYFGTWKSFFGWHKEDVDLYSINYNHAGAAKIWYCVSPVDGGRFDTMARGLFPELHAACPAFVRHKDIMISPRLLRAAGVPFVQARQEPGEFIVLNAAAYHSGFNLGWNVAEAVNFALPEWLPIGREAVPCECSLMPEAVTLDMRIFFPDLRTDSEDEDEEEELSSTSTASGVSVGGSAVSDDAASSSGCKSQVADASSDDEADSEASASSTANIAVQQQQQRRRGKPVGAVKKPGRAPAASSKHPATKKRARTTDVEATAPARKRSRVTGVAASARKSRAGGRALAVVSARRSGVVRHAAGSVMVPGEDDDAGQDASEGSAATGMPGTASPLPTPRSPGSASAAPRSPGSASPARRARTRPVPPLPPLPREVLQSIPSRALHLGWGTPAEARPVALVERGAGPDRAAFFALTHRLARPAGKPGAVWLGLLRQGPDGLFRPSGTQRQVSLGPQFPRLVHVRVEWTEGEGRRCRGGWKLITTRKRILM